MLRSNVTLQDALHYLAQDQSDSVLAATISTTLADLRKGRSIAESFAGFRHVADCSFLFSVNRSGREEDLPRAFTRFSEFLVHKRDQRRSVKQMLIYPTFLGLMAVIVLVFMVMVVVPMMSDIVEDLGYSLPWVTRWVLGAGRVLHEYGFYIVCVLGVGGLSLLVPGIAGKVTSWLLQVLMRIPWVYTISRQLILATFCRDLSMYLSGGMDIASALLTMQDTTYSGILKESIEKMSRGIQRGQSLPSVMRDLPFFPPVLIGMVDAATKSNMLECVLTDCAQFYENEAQDRVKLYCSFIEPALILGMGIVVGVMIVAILLPIYEMTNYMGQ